MPKTISPIKISGKMYFVPSSNRAKINLFEKRSEYLSFIKCPTQRQIIQVFNGSIMFDVVKSRKSKKVLSNNLKFSKSPNDRVAGIEIRAIIKNITDVALNLVILNFSIKAAVGTSTILMPDVNAAKSNKKKNKIPTMFPIGI